jgi:hypothetical protein
MGFFYWGSLAHARMYIATHTAGGGVWGGVPIRRYETAGPMWVTPLTHLMQRYAGCPWGEAERRACLPQGGGGAEDVG